MKEVSLIVCAEDWDAARLVELFKAMGATIRDLVPVTVHYCDVLERVIDAEAETVGAWKQIRVRNPRMRP